MLYNPLPLLVTAVGAYMLVKLRFFFLFHPVATLGGALRALREPRTFRSFSLALAGTLGVGNVLGVCVGISIGGAGSVFWLLVSVVFSSVLKYSEVVLSRDNLIFSDGVRQGGMAQALSLTIPRFGVSLGRCYSLAVVLLSLFMGAALQCDAVVGSFEEIFNTPPHLIAAIMGFLVLVSVLRGAGIIERITSILIPMSTIIYIFLALSVIACNSDRLPSALLSVLQGAFKPLGAAGGVIGAMFSAPIREGYSRGLLSNEAGAGTSSMAHSRAGGLNPAVCGLLGILEVLFDTLLLCTLTALSVLCFFDGSFPDTPIMLIIGAARGTLGELGGYLLSFCIFVFAYSTVICWYHYGNGSLPRRGVLRLLYLLVFIVFVFFGFGFGESRLVLFTDILLFVLTALTSLAVLKSSDRIRELSELGGVLSPDKIKEVGWRKEARRQASQRRRYNRSR